METAKRIYLPPLSLVGPNALQELKEDLKNSSYKQVLFVTDPILVQIGLASKVEDISYNFV